MAKKNTRPDYPTMVAGRTRDGRLIGVDNSVWLYRKVPLAPVAEAKSTERALAAAAPLLAAYEGLATMTSVPTDRRGLARGAYRETHALLVNIPTKYQPHEGPLEPYLGDQFDDAVVFSRLLLFGVRLESSIGTGGWKAAVESVKDTLVQGGTPMSDYDNDFKAVDSVLRNAGLAPMTHQDRALADAWWNQGSFPDTPALPHPDHLHIFTSAEAAAVAEKVNTDDCSEWPDLSGTHAITFASVQDLDLPYVDAGTSAAQWVVPFVQQDAAAVSIRAAVEPAKVTRAELRRQRKQYTDDLNERQSQGKMDRAEHEEKMQELADVEAVYASGGGPATLVDTSILVAFDGQIEDISELSTLHVNLNTMMFRQQQAWAETMLCSNVRANPYKHDLPSTTVAYSGIPSLSTVGDADGVLVGFTESDRQPALLSPTAVSQEDRTPLAVVAAASGAGKALHINTDIPTPVGFVKMGDIKVGDTVFGRDGNPCQVTFVSELIESPEMYRITLSDGQTISADFDHQWVVSTREARQRAGKQRLRVETGHWAKLTSLADELDRLARSHDDANLMTPEEIFDEVKSAPHLLWDSPAGIRAIFRLLETPVSYRPTATEVVRGGKAVTKTDPAWLFPTAPLIRANLAHWRSTGPANRARWGAKLDERIRAAESVLAMSVAGEIPGSMTAAEATRLFTSSGAPMSRTYAAALASVARAAGVSPARGRAIVNVPMPAKHTTTKKLAVYPARTAISTLAARARHLAGEAPNLHADERVMTTGEMLALGVTAENGERNFSIRTADPINPPDADLDIPPYVLGAWLGDGSSWGGEIAGIDIEVFDHIRSLGYSVRDQANGVVHYVHGLVTQLRAGNLWRNKHIPNEYLFASYAQRLELLRGLMDTDGTVDKAGRCEISLSDARLAADTLNLIRSLGIKASMRSGESSYLATAADGTKSKKVTGIRNRITFTTNIDVFRLTRKSARIRVDEELRPTQNRLYVTAIERIESGPARCIQVDSPDSTYLAEGFVPTHNTMMMLWIARQLAEVHRPTVIIDPKLGSDLGDAVLNAGGQIVSLDDLMSADGVFDPLRFSVSPSDGIETAASMLLSVNPFGLDKERFAVPLMASLNYGIRNGATCIGQALNLAYAAGVAPYEMVKAVADLAGASPQFRAMVGVNPQSAALSIHDGITLIKVGKTHLNLPTPGTSNEQADLSQRVSLALLRMMIFGSATALTGRDGVILQDEAWTILGSEPKEVERLGRLARSQRVLPILFSQDISGARKANLAQFISRGFVGPITDPVEATAAMELFGIEVTPERLERVTASATMDSFGRSEFAAPNWNSMKALRDPQTREVLRGSVWMYSDLSGRVIPIEVTLPDAFLKLASTSAADQDARKKAAEEEAARQAKLAAMQQFAGAAG